VPSIIVRRTTEAGCASGKAVGARGARTAAPGMPTMVAYATSAADTELLLAADDDDDDDVGGAFVLWPWNEMVPSYFLDKVTLSSTPTALQSFSTIIIIIDSAAIMNDREFWRLALLLIFISLCTWHMS